jgi:trehalose synthase-fused probable maltokinase
LQNASLSVANFTELQKALPELLPDFLLGKRWFGGKARRIQSIEIQDIVPFENAGSSALFVFARIEYESGAGETYVLPLAAENSADERGGAPKRENPMVFVSPLLPLTDALQDSEILRGLYDAIERKSVFQGARGSIGAAQTVSFADVSLPTGDTSQPKVITGEQSNSSSIFGNRAILKIFRRVQEGVNPELEVGRFLTERCDFKHTPPLGGWLQYETPDGQTMTLGALQGFVPNDGDAWQYTLNSLPGFWQEASKCFSEISRISVSNSIPKLADEETPRVATKLCGPYLDAVALLGRRTAELHQALASDRRDPAFSPEPYTPGFQRQFQQALSASATDTFTLLRSQMAKLRPAVRSDAEKLLRAEKEVLDRIRETLSRQLSGLRTRIHGDFHLGQVLCAAGDFVIIDFEGEPGRTIADRVVKRSALQDVAGMLRSFHYASFAPLLTPIHGVKSASGDDAQLTTLAGHWNHWVSSRFLKSYFESAGDSSFLPNDDREIWSVLRLQLITKALFELSYELNNRPEWVRIPLAGVLGLLEHPKTLPL